MQIQPAVPLKKREQYFICATYILYIVGGMDG